MEIRHKVRLGIQLSWASGRNASKQKLVVQHVAAPPAESPDSQTLTNLGLAPTLQPGRDVLGYSVAASLNDVCDACPWMKLCGQQRQKMQWVDDPCPHPKFVPGRPNLSRPGAPLFAAVNPSRPLSHPGRPKYLTAWPAAQPLAENSPTSHLQHYSGAVHGQDAMVQTKPHSQTHATSVKDLQMFAQSQVLLDSPCQNWQPNQVPILLSLLIHQPAGPIQTRPSGHRHALVPCQGRHLLQEGFGLSSSPRLHGRGAGRDVILPIV